MSKRALVVVLGLSVVTSLAVAPASAVGPTCDGLAADFAATADHQVVSGTSGDDVITGAGFSHLSLVGLGGNDVICAGDGAAVDISSGDGNDTLIGGVRANLFNTGAGDDTVVGGGGRDALEPSPFGGFDAPNGVVIDAVQGTADGYGHDTFSGIRTFYGTVRSDSFTGGPADEDFISEYGADSVRMGAGDDVVRAAGSTVWAGPGNDVVFSDHSGTVFGEDGDDTIHGTLDMETGLGAVGPFSFHGGAGDDVFVPEAAFDEGGFLRSPAWTGVVDGGPGADALSLRHVSSGARVDLGDHTFRWRTGHGTVYGVQELLGSPYGDVLSGGSGRDTLSGRGGPDILRGHGGKDVLIGGKRRDTAYGGTGSDRCRVEIKHSCER
jgi:Ca2+-binding RTX toxin-like protein